VYPFGFAYVCDSVAALAATCVSQGEIAEKRAKQNNFVRQLNDISATIRDMGLYSVRQTAVEDGLVHVDIALPDYKIAIFLEGTVQTPGDGNFIDPEGTVLSGYDWRPVRLLDASKRRAEWVLLIRIFFIDVIFFAMFGGRDVLLWVVGCWP
jgi:hypothetical protein